MTHIAHEPILDAGLQADCERCRQLAEDPVDRLDEANLFRILQGHLYSGLDQLVASRLDRIRRQAARLREVEYA